LAPKKRTRRTLLLLLAIPTVPVLLIALFVGVVLELLHPEPADPELKDRERRALTVRTSPPPTRDSDRCDLKVRALEGIAPVADVEVRVRPRYFELAGWELQQTTDDTGTVRFEALPCVHVELEAIHEDLAGPGVRGTRLLRGELNVEVVKLSRPVELYGRVTDTDGEPVSEATVRVHDRGELTTRADSQGRWSLAVPMDPTHVHLLAVEADALGYHSVNEMVRVKPEGTAVADNDEGGRKRSIPHEFTEVKPGDRLEVDLTLSAASEVQVWCAGLPGDLCNDMLVHCTHPLVPMGETCSQDSRTGETVCLCPDEGRVAVRGGGKATLVEPGETEAWLDFRDAGSITGDILADGKPADDCDVIALRVPNGLEDLPRGFIAAHKTRCDDEGHFELTGLVDGDWELVVEATVPDMGHRQRTLAPSRVRPRRNTDVGDIEMLGGGGIEGRVVNGLTQAPETNGAILAIRRGRGHERSTPSFADTDGQGNFTMEGLPPGEWELCHVLSPHVRTYVTVEDGAITDDVLVETSDATALETNGFSLGKEGGRLVVLDVEPGGPAEAAGLTPGDEVTGLLIAGLDLGSKLGDDADKLLQLVLGHWDGPGITLLVERDGQEQEVELDW